LVLNVCKYALINNGFELILARDGAEGLRAFTEHIHEIALVLTDVAMPKMDGIEMVRRVFALKPDAKIILMAAPPVDVPPEIQKVCLLLRKPFLPKQLLEAVQSILPR
jgi:two-component system cell cycle sensor histidine kinase/response regulator CckA